WQLEQLGALEIALDPAAVRPRFEVGRGVERDVARLAVALVVDGHHPTLRGRVPEEAGVAAAVLDHGVGGELGKGAAPVVAVGDALAAAGAGEGGDDHVVGASLEAGRVVPVHDGAAGEAPVAEAV